MLVAKFVFPDCSPSYADGFVMGKLWSTMSLRRPRFVEIIPTQLEVYAESMADQWGYSFETQPRPGDKVSMTFVDERLRRVRSS